jgi:hypothetical protein
VSVGHLGAAPAGTPRLAQVFAFGTEDVVEDALLAGDQRAVLVLRSHVEILLIVVLDGSERSLQFGEQKVLQ